MRNFQDTFGTGKESFTSDFSICIAVPLRACNLLKPESITDWFTMKIHKLYSFNNPAKELYIHFIPNVGSNRLSDTI